MQFEWMTYINGQNVKAKNRTPVSGGHNTPSVGLWTLQPCARTYFQCEIVECNLFYLDVRLAYCSSIEFLLDCFFLLPILGIISAKSVNWTQEIRTRRFDFSHHNVGSQLLWNMTTNYLDWSAHWATKTFTFTSFELNTLDDMCLW